MRGPARLATYLGRVLVVVGFIMILLAWDGAAELDFIQGQFPYLLSGAIPGLALIIIGAGLEYIQATRQFTAERAKQMAELNLAVLKLVKFTRSSGALQAGHDEEVREPVTVGAEPPRTAVGTPESAFAAPPSPSAAAARSEAPERNPNDDEVVAGRSSFHQSSCHLVTGRDDMATITRVEAEGQGLSPCRVCKP